MATAMYVISDVFVEADWKLGWGENLIEESVDRIIDMIIATTENFDLCDEE